MKKSAPQLHTAPMGELISLDVVKDAVSFPSDEPDTLLQGVVTGAIEYLDGYSGVLGRCLMTQTWEQRFTGFERQIRLPFITVSSAEISYVDSSGLSQNVETNLYEVAQDARGSYVRFRSGFKFPSLDDQDFPVQIRMVSGYGTAADVPWLIKVAVLAIVNACFDDEPGEWCDLPPVRSAMTQFRRVVL
ncbi:hypothetical protein [Phaeobacter sp. NW0010-22]|uniref:hypothetical protein n=1 Tax=Phaeobacter sp. NW0010-22 TaxID=3135907 RepID=UPI00310C1F53